MSDVVRWVDRQEEAEVIARLQLAEEPAAEIAFEATRKRDPKTRSGVYTTAETVLAAGDFRPAKRHRIEHRRQRQRQQREIHAAPPQDQESERGCNRRHDQNARDGRPEERVRHQVALDQRRRIGRKPEPCAVAE